MNLEKVTVQDCIDMQEKKNKSVTLNDGHVIGFEKEESPRGTDQSTPRT